MGWYAEVIFLFLIQYVIATTGVLHNINLPPNFLDEGVHQSQDTIEDEMTPLLVNQYEDFKYQQLGKILANVLLQPWPKGVSPILYVEDISSANLHEQTPVNSDTAEIDDINNLPLKRSRYYRKYPWKRQNSRYDAENRYLCQPTKEDVFRLLVALHEARQGNRGQVINFCNRRRPASAVFTNIRFLG
ncbi:uncharacterized protein LOC103312994 [Tribolium castaneum]|uniref:Uncharacterized protein n=1 Tax=Tribolium castaneum TaxID=7070 RepID=D6WKF4_TRICA|nr:PREDICTED: uncharacterized protein LOC103312994 [Tribolium castaneum]EFA03985.1 hypothetical protein TcasGA2_TC014134 [Tribolium castaneum]|eukprot:XP_008193298.1 PREDICTED: uncharacterized protein LOC103312994 [Tribolium castaneum]